MNNNEITRPTVINYTFLLNLSNTKAVSTLYVSALPNKNYKMLMKKAAPCQARCIWDLVNSPELGFPCTERGGLEFFRKKTSISVEERVMFASVGPSGKKQGSLGNFYFSSLLLNHKSMTCLTGCTQCTHGTLVHCTQCVHM